MLTSFVIDASITVNRLLGDAEYEAVERLFDRLAAGESALAPCIWPAEVSNSLRTAENVGRATQQDSARRIGAAKALPVYVERVTPPAVFDSAYALAVRYTLSVCDATYLELAIRNRHGLATLDRSLRRAAAKAGVEVLPSDAEVSLS